MVSIQKKPLQFLCSDFESNYYHFFQQGKKSKIIVGRFRQLYASLSNRPVRKQHVLDLSIAQPNQVRHVEKSLRVLDWKIWNNLPSNLNSAPNLLSFKLLIKSWDKISCKRNFCKNVKKLTSKYPAQPYHTYIHEIYHNCKFI